MTWSRSSNAEHFMETCFNSATIKHAHTQSSSAHNCLYNLFAHSSCTFLLILLFIMSTVYCPAHLILYIFFYSFFPHTYIYVYSLVFVFHIIALSMERTWLTFYCWLYSVIVYVMNKYFTFWSYILFYKILLMSLLSLLINWINKLTGLNLLNGISFQFISILLSSN